MKKRVLALSLLLAMLISTVAFASSGYMSQSLTLSNSTSSCSSAGYNTSGTARVDISTLTDTSGCSKVKVFVMNTGDGSVSGTKQMQTQNTSFFSVKTGNNKAVFKRACSGSGIMTIRYNFVYNLRKCD